MTTNTTGSSSRWWFCCYCFEPLRLFFRLFMWSIHCLWFIVVLLLVCIMMNNWRRAMLSAHDNYYHHHHDSHHIDPNENTPSYAWKATIQTLLIMIIIPSLTYKIIYNAFKRCCGSKDSDDGDGGGENGH